MQAHRGLEEDEGDVMKWPYRSRIITSGAPQFGDCMAQFRTIPYFVHTIWPTAKPIEHQIEDGNYPIRGAMQVWLKIPP